jgi:hypothetical protein
VTVLRVLAVVGGVAIVVAVLDSAIRTFMLPRASRVRLTTAISRLVAWVFTRLTPPTRSYRSRDRVLALRPPLTLLAYQAVWFFLVFTGFTFVFWGAKEMPFVEASHYSGSALFTLGFANPTGESPLFIVYAEAIIGLTLLALLISYLPTIYAAFSRREVQVAHITARAGSPPSAVDLIIRAHRIEKLYDLDDLWVSWQLWFAELEETHTSLGSLTFFRSPKADRSWVTASGVVLDAAALVNSTIEGPWQPMAALCVRSGFTALRSIADFFGIQYDPDPAPSDPISIAREEFDDVCRQMAAVGVPLRDDRDQAWRDFAGWRVNYDRVLLALAGLTMAPYAMWSSDRSILIRPRIGRGVGGRWMRRAAREG